MPFTEDDCTPILRHCVIVPFRSLCPDDGSIPALGGALRLKGSDNTKQPDGNGGYWLPGSAVQLFSSGAPPSGQFVGVTPQTGWTEIVENGCSYWAIKTCDLPANVDSDYDPDDPASIFRGLGDGTSCYILDLTINGVSAIECTFVIDAAQDYTAIEIDGCIPLGALGDVAGPPVGTAGFDDAVCAALGSFPYSGGPAPAGVYVVGSDCQLHDPGAGGTADSFVTFVDNGDGTSTFTSADGGSTLTVCTDCSPGGVDSFVSWTQVGDTVTFTSADGNSTVDVCATCSETTISDNGNGTAVVTNPDGSTVTVCTDCSPSGVGSTAIDNGDGTATITNSNGTTVVVCTDCGCCWTSTLMADANCQPVTVLHNPETGVTQYVNAAGTPITVDPATLQTPAACASGTGGATSSVVDNGDGTYTHNNGEGVTTVIDPSVDLCPAMTALAPIPTTVAPVSVAVIGDDADCYLAAAPPLPCTVEGGNGLTGTQSGIFVDGCTIEPMPASGDPEDSFPAAGFPNCWRQAFSGGTSGDEVWVVKNDVTGVPQWHQIA